MPRAYSSDFRERAVRMVLERREAQPDEAIGSAVRGVSSKLGIGYETLRKWCIPRLAGDSSSQAAKDLVAENKRLRRENQELKRANEILKLASAFFAAELDRPGPR